MENNKTNEPVSISDMIAIDAFRDKITRIVGMIQAAAPAPAEMLQFASEFAEEVFGEMTNEEALGTMKLVRTDAQGAFLEFSNDFFFQGEMDWRLVLCHNAGGEAVLSVGGEW